jgi:polar amino acid transport system substrate-binding protein
MKRALHLSLLVLLSACATVTTEVPPAAKAELAPTGSLRVALLAPNPLLVTQNTPPGVVKGMAVEIANRLASRLGVPMTPVLYPTIAPLLDSARKGEWDITFLPVDPERAATMNFTAPYMYSESTFLVPGRSAARSLADLDQTGKTIVAVARSTQEVWLRANVRSATIVAASSPAVAQQMFREEKVDAYASVTSLLAGFSRQVPGSRLLPGSFSDSPFALAVVKVRPSADAFASDFVEQLKASGIVQELIERENLTGVRAAK